MSNSRRRSSIRPMCKGSRAWPVMQTRRHQPTSADDLPSSQDTETGRAARPVRSGHRSVELGRARLPVVLAAAMLLQPAPRSRPMTALRSAGSTREVTSASSDCRSPSPPVRAGCVASRHHRLQDRISPVCATEAALRHRRRQRHRGIYPAPRPSSSTSPPSANGTVADRSRADLHQGRRGHAPRLTGGPDRPVDVQVRRGQYSGRGQRMHRRFCPLRRRGRTQRPPITEGQLHSVTCSPTH